MLLMTRTVFRRGGGGRLSDALPRAVPVVPDA